MSRNWATIPQYARKRRQNERTIRNYIGKGYFPVYRTAKSKGVLIDVDEADAALAKIPSARARNSYGEFGPNAKIIDVRRRVVAVERDEAGEQ